MNLEVNTIQMLQQSGSDLKLETNDSNPEDKKNLQKTIQSLKQNLERDDKSFDSAAEFLESQLGIKAPKQMDGRSKVSWLLNEVKQKEVKDQVSILQALDKNSNLDRQIKEALKEELSDNLKEKKHTNSGKEELQFLSDDLSKISLSSKQSVSQYILGHNSENISSLQKQERSNNSISAA